VKLLKFSVLALTLIVGLAARTTVNPQSANDGTLATVRRTDRSSRDANNKLQRLSEAEHLRRANVYMTNRAFGEAREHWQASLIIYPADPRVAEALLGVGRSLLASATVCRSIRNF
jgi:hypothetical protein